MSTAIATKDRALAKVDPRTICPDNYDYHFRPRSYFKDLDQKTLLLSSINGEQRRLDVERRLATGNFDPLTWGDWLTETCLDTEVRSLLSSFHPCLMSGEFLPALGENEIEIARIVLASVTGDVASIRATPVGGEIHYRVVDEYESQFALCQSTSIKPLSFGELIDFINFSLQDGDEAIGGLAIGHIVGHIAHGEWDQNWHGFVTLKSAFYPALHLFYDEVIGGLIDESEGK